METIKRALAAALPRPAYGLIREAYRLGKGGVAFYGCRRYWRRQERTVRRLSTAELRQRQWRRFRDILGLAYDHVPFYRQRYREAGVRPEDIASPADLHRLPILTKDDIRRNFPDRMLDERKRYRPSRVGRTSGSTSDSLFFMRADRNWRRSLYCSVFLRDRRGRTPVFSLTTPNCSPGSCSLRDEDRHDNRLARALQRLPALRPLAGMIGLPPTPGNVLRAPDAYFQGLLETLAGCPERILVADPVYLGALARYMKRAGATLPGTAAIITTYELLTGSLKDLLREVFDCEVHVQYGASELNDIANECRHHRLHLRVDTVLVEAIRDGRPAGDGEIGRAILTDLYNTNMPFIRYDIGDVVTLGSGPCDCGRNSDTIDSIQGRVFDLLTAERGPVTPLEADAIFRGAAGVDAYRLQQTAPGRFDVAVMSADPEAVDRRSIAERCRGLLGAGAEVDVRCTEEIRPEASNKFRFVHSDITPSI